MWCQWRAKHGMREQVAGWNAPAFEDHPSDRDVASQIPVYLKQARAIEECKHEYYYEERVFCFGENVKFEPMHVFSGFGFLVR